MALQYSAGALDTHLWCGSLGIGCRGGRKQLYTKRTLFFWACVFADRREKKQRLQCGVLILLTGVQKTNMQCGVFCFADRRAKEANIAMWAFFFADRRTKNANNAMWGFVFADGRAKEAKIAMWGFVFADRRAKTSKECNVGFVFVDRRAKEAKIAMWVLFLLTGVQRTQRLQTFPTTRGPGKTPQKTTTKNRKQKRNNKKNKTQKQQQKQKQNPRRGRSPRSTTNQSDWTATNI